MFNTPIYDNPNGTGTPVARFRGHRLRVDFDLIPSQLSLFYSGALTFLNGTDGVLGVELVDGAALMVRTYKHVFSIASSHHAAFLKVLIS